MITAFTASQQQAIEAQGNVLVEAGAGAGKTRTLVERCVAWLLKGAPNSIDGIVMVTFTEAAAAEMRHRIRVELTTKLDEQPNNRHLAEQIALLDTAAISTLHSFCLQLVRQHFYDLDLDPQLAVMAEEEAQLLAEETLSTLLQKHYAGTTANAEAVQQLIQVQGRGWDRPIRRLVLRLHAHSQTLPDPEGWLQQQFVNFKQTEPRQWQTWLEEALAAWCDHWLPILRAEPEENANAHQCATILETLSALKPGGFTGATRSTSQTKGRRDESPKAGRIESPAERQHSQRAELLSEVLRIDQVWPSKKKTVLRQRLEDFFEEAAFLHSLTSQAGGAAKADRQEGCPADDPLREDWSWVRPQMMTLLSLTDEFAREFARAKRELGVVDFHDLEQFSLRLLWDHSAHRPTPLAQQWRKKLKLIFVDEYQDINAAQDAILTALGGEGKEANRFLVGDVKQSIYRFRLAAPHIFQGYARDWRSHPSRGEVIPLSDNFRSHEAILDFINPLFRSLMRRELGGVEYDESAWLKFGNRQERRALTIEGEKNKFEPSPSIPDAADGRQRQAPGPTRALSFQEASSAHSALPQAAFSSHVELHLRLTGKQDSESAPEDRDSRDSENGSLEERSSAEQEARLVGLRLREMKMQPYHVWDDGQQRHRPVDWKDLVILLRSPRNKVESYAKEFARLGIPLLATRGGFFESPEVMDLLNLLTLLDNPLQDVPAITVLRSPMVGLSRNELAAIRLAAKGRFWTAIQRFHRQARKPEIRSPEANSRENSATNADATHPSFESGAARDSELKDISAAAWPKVDLFLRQFADWRRLARETSLSHCLERVLNDTHYLAWLATQSRSEQRRANVSKLLTWVRQFDQFHRQGLFRFLKFIEAQKNAEIDREPAPTETENAVRLMSIHQAKGLEFRVVVVADLGKAFNFSDLNESIILDERYGLCPLVKPPFTERRYPSLPYWLAQQRQKREALGEEMRLLYVAMTRACHTLILAGTSSRRNAEKRWSGPSSPNPSLRLQAALSARNYLDWLGPWLNEVTGNSDWMQQAAGQCPLLRWTFYEDQDSRLLMDEPASGPSIEPESLKESVDPAAFEALRRRLVWQYPFLVATQEPAKASVSILRRRINDEIIGESQRGPFAPQSSFSAGPRATTQLNPTEIGTAHHIFCQFVSLDCVHSLEALKAEADRMEEEEVLSPQEREALQIPWVAAFWRGEVGQKILAQNRYVNRELPFTARLSLMDLAELIGSCPESSKSQAPRSRQNPEVTRSRLLKAGGGRSEMALQDEFVVVQGVVDLAVLLPKEIWLLDFKTDLLAPNHWTEKAGLYAPQLKLYSLALGRIYQRPVTHCWLHFLAIGRTVSCVGP